MSVQPIESAIEMALTQISDLERQISERKKTVNGLCQMVSRPAMFPDVDPSCHAPLREDEFYGKQLAPAIRMVLDRRKSAGQGSATVADIYDVLVRGGFHFTTKNAENAKRNIYNALGKSSKFHKLPNGTYGLTEWYPNVRRDRQADEEEEQEEATVAPAEQATSKSDDNDDEGPGAAAAKQTFEEEVEAKAEEQRPKVKAK
jgi:hypothetical protein